MIREFKDVSRTTIDCVTRIGRGDDDSDDCRGTGATPLSQCHTSVQNVELFWAGGNAGRAAVPEAFEKENRGGRPRLLLAWPGNQQE